MLARTPRQIDATVGACVPSSATWWDGHLVVVLEAQLHDAGIILPKLGGDVKGDARAVLHPGDLFYIGTKSEPSLRN